MNLITEAFEDITDQQMIALKVKAGIQRMDSTQIASNIMDMSRLQLMVEGIQRLWRLLSGNEQERYQEWLGEYVKSKSGQYAYRVKGLEAIRAHMLEVGQVIFRLLNETQAAYGAKPTYQLLERLFRDNFKLTEEGVQAKSKEEIGANSLQSLDDQEATFRRKGSAEFIGSVANVTQTCDPDNDVQLVTKVQVAPNNTDDAAMLEQALPDLKQCTGVHRLHTDGTYGSPAVDNLLNEYKIELFQTGIRGPIPTQDKLNLSQYIFGLDENGRPITLTCPQGQKVAVEPDKTENYIACFDEQVCQTCSFALQKQCRARLGKKDPSYKLIFTQQQVNWAMRRKRYESTRLAQNNPRSAIEAIIRSVKYPFPSGQVPVRGRFRVTCMVTASAAMSNIRSICRYRRKITRQNQELDLDSSIFFNTLRQVFSVG